MHNNKRNRFFCSYPSKKKTAGAGRPTPVAFAVDLERGIKQVDAVDRKIKVRSGTEFALMEVTVGNNLGILLKVGVGIHVGQIAVELLAFNRESGNVVNVDLAGFDATITEKNMIRSVLAGGVYL